jgi:hypothetical protein
VYLVATLSPVRAGIDSVYRLVLRSIDTALYYNCLYYCCRERERSGHYERSLQEAQQGLTALSTVLSTVVPTVAPMAGLVVLAVLS